MPSLELSFRWCILIGRHQLRCGGTASVLRTVEQIPKPGECRPVSALHQDRPSRLSVPPFCLRRS